MIQGFGAVGTGAARCLNEMGYKIVAVSDARCMVYCEEGLDADLLIDSVKDRGYLNQEAFKPEYKVMKNSQWEDISCDIFMPAALDGVINGKNAEKLDFKLIVEAANIPTTPEADVVLERRNPGSTGLYRESGSHKTLRCGTLRTDSTGGTGTHR
ncbi:MAG: hypothetical protein ACLRMZ_06300 [Blautia marasmi]